jgi:hypothetical protein
MNGIQNYLVNHILSTEAVMAEIYQSGNLVLKVKMIQFHPELRN